MAESYYSRTIYNNAVLGDDTFVFDFDYVNESDVHVSIDGTETFDFVFLDSHTVKLNNPLLDAAVVTVFRDTFLESRVVDFVNAAELTEKDLDDSADQVFFAMQEAYDLARDSIKPQPDGSFSMSNRRLKDLAYPELPTDGANRDYVDAQYGINSALRNGIEQDKVVSGLNANAAQVSADNAASKSQLANTYAQGALESRTLSNEYMLAAESARDFTLEKTEVVLAKAEEVVVNRDLVVSKVEAAETFKIQAETSNQSALNHELKAKKWAEEDHEVQVEPSRYSSKHYANRASQWAEKPVDSPVEPGAYSALHHAAKTLALKNIAQTLHDTVVTEATRVEQDALTATDARNQAVQAANNAALSEANSDNAKVDAVAAKVAAQDSASSASSNASIATQKAAEASNSASIAVDAEAATLVNAAKAQNWAEASSNVEVEPGLFSAKHWAVVAKNEVNGARNFIEYYDASTGVLPIPSPLADDKGKYWIINVAGTLPQVGYVDIGYELTINEALSYQALSVPQVYLLRGNNLSDLTNPGTARSNLGLGTVATRSVGTAAANIPDITAADARYLGKAANAVSASKWATARTITLGGDLSGSVSVDGTANVTLSAQVADDSHAHTISTVTGLQTALDNKLNTTAAAVSAAKLTTARTITLAGDLSGSTSFNGASNVTLTATVADDSHNHVIANVDGLQAALDAKVDDSQLATASTANSVVQRDSGGDINARLFRSEYDVTNASVGFIMTQIDTVANNFIRPTTPAQFRAAVTDASYLGKTATAAAATKLATARTISLTGGVTGSVSFNGTANVAIATTVADDSHTHDGRYYTEAEVDAKLAALTGQVPKGIISMWSGLTTAIPAGWALCDGLNGTPDLRNRMIMGAGDLYAVGDTGGSKDAVVVNHTHTATVGSNGSHSHSGSTAGAGGHYHGVYVREPGALDGTAGVRGSDRYNTNIAHGTDTTTAGHHAHTFSTNTTGSHTHTIAINAEGEVGTDKNLPPYYALAFIMKL